MNYEKIRLDLEKIETYPVVTVEIDYKTKKETTSKASTVQGCLEPMELYIDVRKDSHGQNQFAVVDMQRDELNDDVVDFLGSDILSAITELKRLWEQDGQDFYKNEPDEVAGIDGWRHEVDLTLLESKYYSEA
ncbi:hypothetical protein C1940_17315 (plasmid) [Lactiplantibacillus plantarum subsp. plantarum]|uniref:hypothetical protein n=1 Tax=Lactiplantibacillus plantarum TaxID=1590 RepID=UPI000CD34FD7|nr:hypothetical protein [Lactiplantibacillus plantarum]AUV74211.1 hypothetical protein C1940_17315 [Lactiplantibacillus plantarum subsp. plantarum]